MSMQENPNPPEKKEAKTVKGSYFEVPGVPISDVKGESGIKKAPENSFETQGIPKAEFKGESGMRSEEKVEEKKTGDDSTVLERKEPKESDFKAPGELGTGYTEKSWEKPKETMESKEAKEEVQERKEPKEKEFKAPGELETGYTEKSWAKPETSMEEKSTERIEKARQGTIEQDREKEAREREARERETREREAREREAREREAREREAREKEAREREAREREAREKEAREEKRTTYTMEKRLTKSKTERMIFGVCGGLGEYLGIDPTLIRLAFVVLAFPLHVLILVLYIILAIIMPSQKDVELVPSYRK